MKQMKLNGEAAPEESQARRLADAIRKNLPAHLGFTLFIFDQGKEATEEDPSHVTYISTATREGMIAVLREFLKKAAP